MQLRAILVCAAVSLVVGVRKVHTKGGELAQQSGSADASWVGCKRLRTPWEYCDGLKIEFGKDIVANCIRRMKKVNIVRNTCIIKGKADPDHRICKNYVGRCE